MTESATPVPAPIRNQLGRFAPGASGNPGGREGLPSELRERLEAGAPAAVERLIELIQSDDERIALAASETLLARLYGRPAQNTETKTEAGSIQQAHLQALQDLAFRRRKTDQDAVVIDVPAAE